MKTQVSLVRCSTYDFNALLSSVRASVDLLGGMECFIKPGSRVLVKPNLLMAVSPDSGIVTHANVVRAVICLLKELNCRVIVGDGPSVWGSVAENVDNVYDLTGIAHVCKQENVELVKFEHKRWRKKFPLTTWIDECDYLVNVPKFKTHELTLMTAAIKNLFGLVWGTYKTELHKQFYSPQDFSNILVDIFQQAPPSLNIVDGIVALEGDGPATSGTPRRVEAIVCGADAVAVDSVLASIMKIKPEDCLVIREASNRKLGVSNLDDIEIVGEPIASFALSPFKLPATSFRKKIPQPIVNFVKKFIRYFPVVNQTRCIKCCRCQEICPQKVITVTPAKTRIAYARCIACFCCQEVCPVAAISVKKSLGARLIGL